MDYKIPTRDEAIKQAQLLIEGNKSAREIGLWASEISYPKNRHLEEELHLHDPILLKFLEALSFAAEPNLYGKESFIAWLKEFKTEIEDERKINN